MSAPSVRQILLRGTPGIVRESVLPLGAFVLGLKLEGLAAGIALSVLSSVLIYVYERTAGRDALLVRLALAFVLVQGAVGLAADSATVYLAQPVLASAAWGVVFLGSAIIRRPLAGTFASAWYPFPPEFRANREFTRVFGVVSVVWALYFLARSGIRLTMLLTGASINSCSRISSRARR